jgi:hypothetical protein
MRHSLETAVAVAASLVAVAFALSTFERWLTARRRQELAWTGALAMFAAAAGALAAGAQAGWSSPTFRTFYLFGAIIDVPLLALGTVYLLAGKRTGDVAAWGVSLFAAFAAGVVVTAPFRAPLPTAELVQGSKVFGPLPRVLAATGSAGGALVIFVGAGWSGWRVVRTGAPRRVLWSNAAIAAGTLILSGSGTLNSVFGAMTAFAVTLLIGIAVIFAGFLMATAGPGRTPAIPAADPWKPPTSRPARPGVDGGAASRPDRAAVRVRT